MKKFSFVFLGLTILLCARVTVCSGKSVPDESVSAIIDELVPENITNVELSDFYNGSVVEPQALNQEEIEKMCAWVSLLSLTHRTFKEGEAPNDLNGGTAYSFSFNDGEISFSWVNVGKKYIHYEGEWYEIMNILEPPLDLPG